MISGIDMDNVRHPYLPLFLRIQLQPTRSSIVLLIRDSIKLEKIFLLLNFPLFLIISSKSTKEAETRLFCILLYKSLMIAVM